MPAKYTILYAEDDLDDLHLVEQVFHSYSKDFEVKHASNGKEALQWLARAEKENALPNLIILDINMPLVDGRETLMQIKKSEALKNIPVVIFSTSSSPIDKLFAQKYNVSFFTKPLAFKDLNEMVKAFIKIGGVEV